MAATIRVLRLPCKRPSANFVPIASFTSSDEKPSTFNYLKDIRKKLADSPRLSQPPHSTPPLSSPPESFRELYSRSFGPNGLESRPHAPKPATSRLPLDAISKGLQQIRESNVDPCKKNISPPFSALKANFRLRPGDLSTQEPPVAAGSHFPSSKFPKVIKDVKDGNHIGAVEALSVSVYDDTVVGGKLRSLRPDHKGKKNWFSLQELNDRLFKVKEILREESNSKYGHFADFRNALTSIKISTDAKDQSRQTPRLDILRVLGEKSDYLARPPKEHLVEKYFDPALMSSAEKMKLELKKVRDEFKMSESDCGSARVQVAQLTTKIKHLSGVLHKKDKHSRKGLQEMVQKRKKILKYLRRTDWDSYCLVLSKFGLRDNPDYKS